MPLGGVPVLRRVIDRCQKIPGVDKVIVAIPEGDYNKPLADLASESGAEVIVGNEQDVLSRYVKAYEAFPADYIMRVTSDCPLLDPEICQRLLEGVKARKAEYGATAWWPHGLDCEVMTAHALETADKNASGALDREHVTLWIKRQKDWPSYIFKPDTNYQAGNRWVLDYPEDYQFLETLFSVAEVDQMMSWKQILGVVDQHGKLRDINAGLESVWREKNTEIYRAASKSVSGSTE